MRSVIAVLAALLVMGAQAAFAQSPPSNPIDEYAAHRHVRMMHDLAICLRDMARDLDRAALEHTSLPYNTGFAAGYRDPITTSATLGYPLDNFQSPWVLEHQVRIMQEMTQKAIDLCNDLLGDSIGPVSLEGAPGTCPLGPYQLSPRELDLIRSIRNNFAGVSGGTIGVMGHLNNLADLLAVPYPFTNYALVSQSATQMRNDILVRVIIPELDELAAPRNLDCDW